MDESSERLPRTIWIGVGLIIILICVAYVLSKVEGKHPVKSNLPVISVLPEFTLTNQSDQVFTRTNLLGHVWVTDIIFTRCAGPCPQLTAQMKSLQDVLADDNNAKLLTLTTDPEFDTPEILRRYATRFGADTNRWTFLTGEKKEIASLAVDGLKLIASPKEPQEQENPADLFIHSTFFVVVDKQARLRMAYETFDDDIEWTNVRPKILDAVHQLEAEE